MPEIEDLTWNELTPPEPTPELKAKVAKDLKDSIEFVIGDSATYVIVVAVHKDAARNCINKISCKKGVPIGGYIYDTLNETYHVECAEYFHLGFIPVSYSMRLKGVHCWKARIPAPENIIKKCLSTFQKKELRYFRSQFRAEEYDLHFVQMVDPN